MRSGPGPHRRDRGSCGKPTRLLCGPACLLLPPPAAAAPDRKSGSQPAGVRALRPDPTRRFPALESRDAKGEAADKAKQPGRLQKGETRRRGPGSLPSWRPGGPFPGDDDRDSPQW